MFKNLTVAQRLALGFGSLVLMLMVLASVSLWKMGTLNAAAVDLAENWLPSVDRVNRMNTNMSDLRIAEWRHVANTDDKAMVGIEKEMEAVKADFEANRKAYSALISSDEERRLYEAFVQDWKSYMKHHAELLELSRANQNDKAKALLEGDSQRLFDDASVTLLKLVNLNGAGAAESRKASASAYAQARLNSFLVAAAAIVIAVLAGTLISRSLTRQLGGEPAQARDLARSIAKGNLSEDIRVREGDNDSLFAALREMQQGLTRTVHQVRQNAESVATASAQIAQGNQDLSGRTEEQASALQQTAATMEQLGTTVRNNADRTRQANQLAQAAAGVATQGGEVVGQVVGTMQGISESSRKIGDIIGVIDGIAFQTNILALNAAVEAARAGEQGRGFAVVAGEVRTLAQRSAEAAKEIKSLISRNVEQVEQGTALVDRAGKTMDEIVGSIRRVSDIVAEISSATAEQSSGIQQVGDAVGQMDQATQQNAALVEEGAAAAASLKAQAQQLVQAVSVFKLVGGVEHAAAPAAYVAAPRTAVQRVTAAGAGEPRQKAKAPAAPPQPDKATTPVVTAQSEREEWATF